MPYRMRYTVEVAWVGQGMGPVTTPTAQKLVFTEKGGTSPNGQNVFGAGTGGAINAADVTTLTNALAADIAAQMNLAANLAIMQGWISGLG